MDIDSRLTMSPLGQDSGKVGNLKLVQLVSNTIDASGKNTRITQYNLGARSGGRVTVECSLDISQQRLSQLWKRSQKLTRQKIGIRLFIAVELQRDLMSEGSSNFNTQSGSNPTQQLTTFNHLRKVILKTPGAAETRKQNLLNITGSCNNSIDRGQRFSALAE